MSMGGSAELGADDHAVFFPRTVTWVMKAKMIPLAMGGEGRGMFAFLNT
jgi:hypothetical protein